MEARRDRSPAPLWRRLHAGVPVSVLMIRPNDHCGDAEIAGHWPPGWVAPIGALARRDLGFDERTVIDAGQIVALKRSRPNLAADVTCKGAPVRLMACGGAPEAPPEALEVIESR